MSEKRKFKVGDKVRVKKFDERPFHWNCEGGMDYLMGTIVEIHSVCADGDLKIESEGGNWGFWYLRPEDVEPLKNECIVIYRKGQEVIALDKATGKKAIAKCSPEDEFDFNIGSKLAFERLLGIEQPNYKEVKRKAKKGEYVKIVLPSMCGGAYGKGDVLKVINTDYCGVYCVGADITIESGYYVCNTEYVVLEGYQPPKEEKKVGCFKVLCIKECRSHGDLAFKKGKVYEYRDGFCKREDDFTSGFYSSFGDLLERNISYRDYLIELKEGEDPDEIMKQYYDFLEKFEEGKLYVFRKEIHAIRNPKFADETWCRECDGKVVNVEGSYDGRIGSYGISPSWCEEIGYKK